jgi:uncharacterized RDD family membrane protein YckC
MEYAGFWRRFLAFWVDVVVFLPIFGLTYLLSWHSRLFYLYWFIPGQIIGLWFYVYLVVRYGGTPGKLLLKTRIAMVDGSQVTMKAAVLRYSVLCVLSTFSSLGYIMASLAMTDDAYFSLSFSKRAAAMAELAPPWFSTIDVLMQVWIWGELFTVLFNTKRRAVHDFLAGTVVIRHPMSFRTQLMADVR